MQTEKTKGGDKKKKSNGAAWPEEIDGTVLSKVVESVLDKTLESIGLEPLGTLPEKVKAFHKWTEKNSEAAKVGDCDNCGGSSDIDKFSEACPYCGETDEGAKPPMGLAGGTNDKPSRPAKSRTTIIDPDEDDDGDDGPLSEVEEGAEVHSMQTTATNGSGKKKNGASTAIVAHAMPAEVLPSVRKSKPPAGGFTVDDLDAAIQEIRAYEGTAGENAYHCFSKLSEVNKTQMWKVRVGKNGKPAYKSFEQFAKVELGMSKRYAFMMMGVAANYTADQVKKFGATKLRLVLEAPKEQRAKLMDKVKKGASKSEIEKEIPRKRKTAKKSGITVATLLGKKSVKLYVRGSDKGGKDPKAAKKVSDQPIGTMELTNEVRMIFALTANTAGELSLSVTTKRIEE